MEKSNDFDGTVRILVVNHNGIFREGLRSFIEANSDMKLAGAVADADTALGLFAAAQPDLTLVDLNLPFGRSTDLIRRIREMDADAWIVGLVTYEWDERGAEALAAGASAVLSKDLISERLQSLVRSGPQSSPPPARVKESPTRWRTYLRGLLAHSDLRA